MNEKLNIQDLMFDQNISSTDRSIGNNLYGYNFTVNGLGSLPSNKDVQGFTFFTRPMLNLSTKNIRNIRQMYSLLTKNELSMQRFVRNTLDPRLSRGSDGEVLSCPLVDESSPFISILSNTLTSLSGWPDMVLPTFSSPNGLRKEQISMIDGTYEIFDEFDLSATFKNFSNEPLTLLFQTWEMYASLVFEGMLYPYDDMIVENEIDYNTRIYRFVMDKNSTYIKKVAATGASYPSTMPSGKFFDLDRNEVFSKVTDEININFKCMGAMYNDDILLKEFNMTSIMFNPEVKKYLSNPKDPNNDLIKVPTQLVDELNFRAIPAIDLETYELMWLISKSSPTYNRLINNDNPLSNWDGTNDESTPQINNNDTQNNLNDLLQGNSNVQ